MTKRIKTLLKFQKSDRDKMSFVAYVRKDKSGSWKGCRETDGNKKKIVLADKQVAETMMENVLYSTTLIPMKECMGFVAISAEPVRFTANINTIIDDDRYMVEVKFGNKTIVYDPSSSMENRRTIPGIIETLLHRIDIKHPDQVIEDFREAAEIVLAYYKADHRQP